MAEGGQPFTLWLPKWRYIPAVGYSAPGERDRIRTGYLPGVPPGVLPKSTSRPYCRHLQAAIFPVVWDFS